MYKQFNSFFLSMVFMSLFVLTGNASAVSNKTSSTVKQTKASVVEENRVSINIATLEDLQKVKGIGKKKSQSIIEYRNKKGKFKSLEDLLKIDCGGVNEKWLDKVSKFLKI